MKQQAILPTKFQKFRHVRAGLCAAPSCRIGYLPAIILVLIIFVTNVTAKTPCNTFGLGIDLQANNLILNPNLLPQFTSHGNGSQNSTGYSIFADYRWKKFGAELGYTYIDSAAYGGFNAYNNNYYLDGFYFYHLFDDVELKGMAGMGYLSSHMHGTRPNNISNNYNTVSLRVGLGLQNNFTEHFALGFMGKFQASSNNNTQFYWYMNTISLYALWYC